MNEIKAMSRSAKRTTVSSTKRSLSDMDVSRGTTTKSYMRPTDSAKRRASQLEARSPATGTSARLPSSKATASARLTLVNGGRSSPAKQAKDGSRFLQVTKRSASEADVHSTRSGGYMRETDSARKRLNDKERGTPIRRDAQSPTKKDASLVKPVSTARSTRSSDSGITGVERRKVEMGAMTNRRSVKSESVGSSLSRNATPQKNIRHPLKTSSSVKEVSNHLKGANLSKSLSGAEQTNNSRDQLINSARTTTQLSPQQLRQGIVWKEKTDVVFFEPMPLNVVWSPVKTLDSSWYSNSSKSPKNVNAVESSFCNMRDLDSSDSDRWSAYDVNHNEAYCQSNDIDAIVPYDHSESYSHHCTDCLSEDAQNVFMSVDGIIIDDFVVKQSEDFSWPVTDTHAYDSEQTLIAPFNSLDQPCDHRATTVSPYEEYDNVDELNNYYPDQSECDVLSADELQLNDGGVISRNDVTDSPSRRAHANRPRSFGRRSSRPSVDLYTIPEDMASDLLGNLLQPEGDSGADAAGASVSSDSAWPNSECCDNDMTVAEREVDDVFLQTDMYGPQSLLNNRTLPKVKPHLQPKPEEKLDSYLCDNTNEEWAGNGEGDCGDQLCDNKFFADPLNIVLARLDSVAAEAADALANDCDMYLSDEDSSKSYNQSNPNDSKRVYDNLLAGLDDAAAAVAAVAAAEEQRYNVIVSDNAECCFPSEASTTDVVYASNIDNHFTANDNVDVTCERLLAHGSLASRCSDKVVNPTCDANVLIEEQINEHFQPTVCSVSKSRDVGKALVADGMTAGAATEESCVCLTPRRGDLTLHGDEVAVAMQHEVEENETNRSLSASRGACLSNDLSEAVQQTSEPTVSTPLIPSAVAAVACQVRDVCISASTDINAAAAQVVASQVVNSLLHACPSAGSGSSEEKVSSLLYSHETVESISSWSDRIHFSQVQQQFDTISNVSNNDRCSDIAIAPHSAAVNVLRFICGTMGQETSQENRPEDFCHQVASSASSEAKSTVDSYIDKQLSIGDVKITDNVNHDAEQSSSSPTVVVPINNVNLEQMNDLLPVNGDCSNTLPDVENCSAANSLEPAMAFSVRQPLLNRDKPCDIAERAKLIDDVRNKSITEESKGEADVDRMSINNNDSSFIDNIPIKLFIEETVLIKPADNRGEGKNELTIVECMNNVCEEGKNEFAIIASTKNIHDEGKIASSIVQPADFICEKGKPALLIDKPADFFSEEDNGDLCSTYVNTTSVGNVGLHTEKSVSTNDCLQNDASLRNVAYDHLNKEIKIELVTKERNIGLEDTNSCGGHFLDKYDNNDDNDVCKHKEKQLSEISNELAMQAGCSADDEHEGEKRGQNEINNNNIERMKDLIVDGNGPNREPVTKDYLSDSMPVTGNTLSDEKSCENIVSKMEHKVADSGLSNGLLRFNKIVMSQSSSESEHSTYDGPCETLIYKLGDESFCDDSVRKIAHNSNLAYDSNVSSLDNAHFINYNDNCIEKFDGNNQSDKNEINDCNGNVNTAVKLENCLENSLYIENNDDSCIMPGQDVSVAVENTSDNVNTTRYDEDKSIITVCSEVTDGEFSDHCHIKNREVNAVSYSYDTVNTTNNDLDRSMITVHEDQSLITGYNETNADIMSAHNDFNNKVASAYQESLHSGNNNQAVLVNYKDHIVASTGKEQTCQKSDSADVVMGTDETINQSNVITGDNKLPLITDKLSYHLSQAFTDLPTNSTDDSHFEPKIGILNQLSDKSNDGSLLLHVAVDQSAEVREELSVFDSYHSMKPSDACSNIVSENDSLLPMCPHSRAPHSATHNHLPLDYGKRPNGFTNNLHVPESVCENKAEENMFCDEKDCEECRRLVSMQGLAAKKSNHVIRRKSDLVKRYYAAIRSVKEVGLSESERVVLNAILDAEENLKDFVDLSIVSGQPSDTYENNKLSAVSFE